MLTTSSPPQLLVSSVTPSRTKKTSSIGWEKTPPTSEGGECSSSLFLVLVRGWLRYVIFPTPKRFLGGLFQLLRVKVIPPRVSDYFSKIIEETIRTRTEKQIERPDMIHLLMEAQKGRQHLDEEVKVSEGFSSVSESEMTKNRRDQEITLEDITAQAFIFFLAGFETISTVLAFTFYELAVDQDVQNRLRDEIQSISAKPTYESLLGMKYLDMVVSEALRKWPSAVVTDREVSKEFTIQPTQPGEKPLGLEKGIVCWLPMFAIHRDPRFYPDPEKFDPERFNDENKHKINPTMYMPFGAGPRNCIGSRFALLEMKLILFHVLKNFEVVPVERTPIPLVLDKDQINLNAKGGMWLGLKKLSNKHVSSH
jgi:cytochrome P450 family 9